MLLAQAQEIAKAATKELERAAEYGFAAYCLVLFFLVVIGGMLVHFWFIVRPDQKQRLDSLKTQDECLTTFATNYAVQTQLLSQIDSRLSAIGKELPATKCRMTGPANPQGPFTLQPTGGA